MAFELPTGGAVTNEANILTKIPNALNALRDGSATIGTGGGTANAQTITTSPAFTALTNGLKIGYKPTLTNTSGVNVALDGLIAKAVLKRQAGALVALVAGDIAANIQVDLTFVTQNDAWILGTNPKVALTNIANTFTLNQEIKKLFAALTIDATTGNPQLFLYRGGFSSCALVSPSANNLDILDAGNNPGVSFDLALGKMTLGTVPNARTFQTFYGASQGSLVIGPISVTAGDFFQIVFRANCILSNTSSWVRTWMSLSISAGATTTDLVAGGQHVSGPLSTPFTGYVSSGSTFRVLTSGTVTITHNLDHSGAASISSLMSVVRYFG